MLTRWVVTRQNSFVIFQWWLFQCVQVFKVLLHSLTHWLVAVLSLGGLNIWSSGWGWTSFGPESQSQSQSQRKGKSECQRKGNVDRKHNDSRAESICIVSKDETAICVADSSDRCGGRKCGSCWWWPGRRAQTFSKEESRKIFSKEARKASRWEGRSWRPDWFGFLDCRKFNVFLFLEFSFLLEGLTQFYFESWVWIWW